MSIIHVCQIPSQNMLIVSPMHLARPLQIRHHVLA